MCQEMATILTEKILESVQHYENFRIPIGVSNRHVHVSRADLDRLYGKDYALTHKSELGQPGQFAANETVTLQGPKGTFEHVRILGPVRSQSQVEISKTDSFRSTSFPVLIRMWKKSCLIWHRLLRQQNKE